VILIVINVILGYPIHHLYMISVTL